jgi:secreted trypsin-like serine protease
LRAKLGLFATALSATLATAVSGGSAHAAVDRDPPPRQPSPPVTQIIGGRDVPDGKYPFLVSVQMRAQDGSWTHFCGGSLIDKRGAVLTAAHCIQGTPETALGKLRAVVGRTDLSTDQGHVRGITGFKVSPGYPKKGDDAALLFLDAPVALPTVKLVTPGTDALERPGRQVTVAGWGSTGRDPDGPGAELPTFPDRLREVAVPLVSDDECAVSYGKEFQRATMICAGRNGKDSCQGDSGGPLFVRVPGRTEYLQFGVVSWGHGCGATGKPGVYTQLSNREVGAWVARFGFDPAG